MSEKGDVTNREVLLHLVMWFLQPHTLFQAIQILEEHPELLTDAADATFLEVAEAQDSESAKRMVEDNRNLLRYCREVGVARAFADRRLPPEAIAEAERQGLTPECLIAEQVAIRHLDYALKANEQYRSTGERTALDAAVTTLDRAIRASTFSSTTDHLQVTVLAQACDWCLRRYDEFGGTDCLDRAVSYCSRALTGTPAASTNRSASLSNLGKALLSRFGERERSQDLEDAVRLFESAVAATPAGSSDLPSFLYNLAAGLQVRARYMGRPEDLEEAIRILHRVLGSTPSASGERPAYLCALGDALRERYDQSNRFEDLDEAIRALREGVAEMPPRSTKLPLWLASLGTALGVYAMRTGRFEATDEAVRFYRRGVAEAPEGSTLLPFCLNELGTGLEQRFQWNGQLQDMDEAIQAFQEAVDLTPEGSLNLPGFLSNLGSALLSRFQLARRAEDVDQSVRLLRRVVTRAPEFSADLPRFLRTLADALSGRYGFTGQREDLDEAERYARRAVDLGSKSSPSLSSLNTLSTVLRQRFERYLGEKDLDEAILVSKRAVAVVPKGSRYMPRCLNDLGIVLSLRFEHAETLDDLESAIEAFEGAVAATPDGGGDLPYYLGNLANGLRIRFTRTGSPEDMEAAIVAFRRACELGSVSAPEAARGAAWNWGRWASQRHQWGETAEAYGFGLGTGRQILARQLVREQKESVLRGLRGMALQAAYALAKISRFEDAVKTIEKARARLLGEALERGRRDLERLPALGHADLYQRYREIMQAQEYLTRPAAERLDQPVHLTSQARLDAIVAANADFNQVVAEIQALPGYADFLAEPTFSLVQAAARDAPLVYLVATPAGGLALIVNADGVEPVWIDELTETTLLDWLRGPAGDPELGGWLGAYQNRQQDRDSWFSLVDDVTSQLWSRAMESVAAALRQLLPTDPSAAPDVTLIPAGLLALLPLHAAWTENPSTPTGRRYFLDEFTVSYAPSALVLQHCHERATASNGERLLAIDEPQPITRGGPLYNAGREVAAISTLFAESTVLQHQAATHKWALDALPTAYIAHFACHGYNDWQSPLDSGLLMAEDQLLTVRDFLEIRLHEARLATLSACETGVIGTDLPDEAVMLPSALVQAGYAGVIASLWSVADVSTAMLMVRFYQFWRIDRLEPAQALRASQRWLRDTTNQEKADYFSQFVPSLAGSTSLAGHMNEEVAAEFFYVAITQKEGPDARSFAHLYWWAAFFVTGI